MLTVQGQEDVRVHPAQALQLQQLPADGHLPAQHGELRVLPGDRGVGAHRLGEQHVHHPGTWRPITATVSGAPSGARVMMPAFSLAIPAMSAPR